MLVRVFPRTFRFCSSVGNGARFSEEEVQAILELRKKSENPWTKAAENVMKHRSWASAPVVEVSGRLPVASWQRVSKSGKRFSDDDDVERPVVKIRWAKSAERNVDILLNDYETLYSVEVKAVLYGVIQAIQLGESKVTIRNSNEVVVKVANGKYKANKETQRFELIRRVLNDNGTKTRQKQLKAKLERLEAIEKGIRRTASVELTENEFFDKYRDGIERLKNYV